MSVIYATSDYYWCVKTNTYRLRTGFGKWLRRMFIISFLVVSLQPSSAMFGKFVAEQKTPSPLVNFVISTNPSIEPKEAQQIVVAATKWGDKFHIDPKLLLAIAKHESTFNKHSISPVGAIGLYQVMIKFHTDKLPLIRTAVGTPEPFDISSNTYMGAMVLRGCINRFQEIHRSLLCYNGASTQNGYDKMVLDSFEKIRKI